MGEPKMNNETYQEGEVVDVFWTIRPEYEVSQGKKWFPATYVRGEGFGVHIVDINGQEVRVLNDEVKKERNPQRWTWVGEIERCYEKLGKASPGFDMLRTLSDDQLQDELARMEREVEASGWVDLS
jgi:hypothetical protein